MIKSLASLTRHRKAIVNLAVLYAGKTSGVLVAFFFLPLYSKLLGANQFGMVAVILSLQALLMMIDLGMSTLVSRDVAAAESSPEGLIKLIHTAEINLSSFYLLLLVITAAIKTLGGVPGVDFGTALATVTLFWLLVLQNLYYSATLARQTYIAGAVIQILGVILRAIVSWYFLANYSSTLFTFIVTQLVIGAAHTLASRLHLLHFIRIQTSVPRVRINITFHDCFSLLGRGRAILVSGVVGAAAMQLDKPLISFFMSPKDITPYFFAVTLSAMPVGLLAGPIVQYFQPRIVVNISQKDYISYKKNIIGLTAAIVALAVMPAVLLFVFNDLIVNLWLGASTQSDLISSYSRILLIGYGIAAVGYIPYVVIIAKQDYHFQAKLSFLATVFVLTATTISAYASSIVFVCYAYAVYFTIATVGLFARAIILKNQYHQSHENN